MEPDFITESYSFINQIFKLFLSILSDHAFSDLQASKMDKNFEKFIEIFKIQWMSEAATKIWNSSWLWIKIKINQTYRFYNLIQPFLADNCSVQWRNYSLNPDSDNSGICFGMQDPMSQFGKFVSNRIPLIPADIHIRQ